MNYNETVILITEEQLKTNTPLGGNVDVAKLLPALKTVQNSNIKQILGAELYIKLQEDYEDDNLTGDYEELLIDYIQPMIIHQGTAYYLTYGAYQFSNKGAYKASSDNYTTLTKDEVDYVVKSQEKLYKMYKKDFYSWIKDKSIPEYVENKKAKTTKRIGGWILKDNLNC